MSEPAWEIETLEPFEWVLHTDELEDANASPTNALPFPSYSLERLVARAPEVVLVGTHSDHAPSNAPLERLGLGGDKLKPVDGDLLFRPGPRLTESAAEVARALHPEVFR